MLHLVTNSHGTYRQTHTMLGVMISMLFSPAAIHLNFLGGLLQIEKS